MSSTSFAPEMTLIVKINALDFRTSLFVPHTALLGDIVQQIQREFHLNINSRIYTLVQIKKN